MRCGGPVWDTGKAWSVVRGALACWQGGEWWAEMARARAGGGRGETVVVVVGTGFGVWEGVQGCGEGTWW